MHRTYLALWRGVLSMLTMSAIACGGDGNKLENPGFENADEGWKIYPIGTGNLGLAFEGQPIYEHTDTFAPFAGGLSLKMSGDRAPEPLTGGVRQA